MDTLALYDAYHEAGRLFSIPVADAGQAFYTHAEHQRLYAHDDYHPNHAGSRLAAETIAAVIRDLAAGVA